MQFHRPATSSKPQLADPRLLLITDDTGRSADDLTDIVLQAVAGGITMVQFREKSLPPAASLNAINQLAAALVDTNVPLLINSDILETLPEDSRHDGVHYTTRGWPRRAQPDGRIVGWSTHSPLEIHAVTIDQCSYVTFGPVYDTPSKAGIIETTGVEGLAKVLTRPTAVPVIALGGIDITNAGDCVRAGSSGVAVMRAIMSAVDPRQTAADLISAVNEALSQQ